MIGVGVVGVGFGWDGFHCQRCAAMAISSVGVASANFANAHAAARSFAAECIRDYFGSCRILVLMLSIICAPNYLHAEIT